MRSISWQKKIGFYNLEKEEKNLFQKIYNQNNITSYKSPKFLINKDNFQDIRSLKLWVGHTNFQLTDAEIEKIGNLTGIESINFLSPYRFEIVIAELYSDIEVRNKISDFLCQNPVVSKKLTVNDMRINLLKEDLSKNYKYWAILIDKENGITQIHGENEASFYEELQTLSLVNNYSQIIKCDK